MLAILLLRAAHNWNLTQTAERFLFTAETIASWTKRAATEETEDFITLSSPVNKFPEFVAESVRQLKTLSPFLGKAGNAEILSRAGLHLGVTTVQRMLTKTDSAPSNSQEATPEVTATKPAAKSKRIKSKRPNHIWLMGMTVVPILSGMWTAWLPFALPQVRPFCYWLCVLMDHKSRKVLEVHSFLKQPNARDVNQVLTATIQSCGCAPKYLICDQGSQFTNADFKCLIKRKNICVRYGAVGKHGSIALIERLIWSIKYEWLNGVSVPARMKEFQTLLDDSRTWHNTSRPHMALKGKTPNEVYYHRSAANAKPRIEPREHWPRGSPCELPAAKVNGKRGQRFTLRIRRH